MKVLKESGLSQNKLLVLTLNVIKCQKLDDLDFSRKQLHPGSFTASETVNCFMEKLRAKKRNECTLRSIFKGTLANPLRRKLLYSIQKTMGKI